MLPGICALILFPKLPRADLVYPTLILELLPKGLMGLLVAGFAAATMVTIASLLNSASTVITMDLVRRFRPAMSGKGTVLVGRWATGAMLLVAVSWAPQLQIFPSLWQYLQAVLAYAVPPVVAVFLAGMFWRGANAGGAVAAMTLGSLCGLALFLINGVFQWTHFHFLYAAPLLTVLDIGILIAVSARHPLPPSASGEATMWRDAFRRAEEIRLRSIPVWQDYRYLSAALLALTAVVVFVFR